jgi:hypothetical protein
VKGMMRGAFSGDVDGAFGSFFSGIVALVVSWLLACASGVLLLIAIVVNLGSYFSR